MNINSIVNKDFESFVFPVHEMPDSKIAETVTTSFCREGGLAESQYLSEDEPDATLPPQDRVISDDTMVALFRWSQMETKTPTETKFMTITFQVKSLKFKFDPEKHDIKKINEHLLDHVDSSFCKHTRLEVDAKDNQFSQSTLKKVEAFLAEHKIAEIITPVELKQYVSGTSKWNSTILPNRHYGHTVYGPWLCETYEKAAFPPLSRTKGAS